MTDTAAKPRSRLRRWFRRILMALGLLLLIALAGAAWVVRNLNTGWVKERLRSITGLELDYTDAKLKVLSGIHLSGLTVASAEKWRAIAPLVFRAGGLDLGWSLFSKHGGLQTIIAEDVELTLAIDEHGHTSLEGLRDTDEDEEPEPEPPLTPGHLLAHVMEALPQFGRVSLSRTNLTILRTQAERVVERVRVTGVDLDARSRGGKARQNVRLLVGKKAAPDQLALDWQRDAEHGDATGKLWLDAQLDADKAEVHGELAYDQQTLSKEWPKKATLLAIDGKARAEHDRLAAELARFELVDQAITAKGNVDVDPGRAHVINAQGKLDIDRLVHLLPKGLVPVELREGHARYDVALLEISATPSLDPKGRLEIDGALGGVRLSGSTALSLDQAKLEVRGKPTPHGGLHLTADLPAGTLHVEAAGTRGNLGGVHLTAGATFAPGRPGQVEARVRFNDISGDGPPGQLAATAGDVSFELAELILDPRNPRAFDGTVKLAAALGTFDARRPDLRTHVADLRFDAHTRVAKGAPGPLEVTLPLGSVEVASRTETLLPAGPARLGLRVDRVRIDPVAPARSSLDGRVDATVGPITLGASFQKHAEAVDFDLSLDARHTSLLTAFAPASLELPGARMAMKLGAKGRLDGRTLRAQATLHVDKPGVTIAEDAIAAAQLDATASLDGSLDKQTLSFTLAPQSLSLDDEPLGTGRIAATASWDLSRPSVEVHLDGQGDALPSGKLTLSASIDKKSRALTYSIDGDLGHLAALDPLLPASLTDDHWLDLSDLRARIQSHGTLTGLVRAVSKRGVPELEPHPLATLSGDDQLDVQLEQVHYVDVRGVELTLPGIELSARVRGEGERRAAELIAHVAKASLVVGEHRLDLAELRDEIKLTAAGDPRSGEIDGSHTLTLGKLEQDWLTAYPIAKLRWTGRARRGPDGTLHVDEVTLDNPGGGTHLVASGSLILPRTTSLVQATATSVPLVGFRSMTLSASLDQKLDPIAGDPKHFKGSGSIAVVADVASGDLHRFHIVSSTRLHKASIELPDQHLALVGLDGTLPLAEDLRVDKKKTSFAEVHDTNVYPTLRFSDQHPFLSGSGGLTAEKITVGNLTLARVAGNLRLQRNLFAVDQLEAETRGGRISGQCLLEMKGQRSTLQMRLRMTGIEAIHGGTKERFDGNAALAFSVADRTVEGRAEIVRIGRHHLFDLLDGYDPQHTDAATNRVRTALALGYPDHVRVLFERGFASYSITFGGLARLVRVDDVHGVPTGPLIDRYLGPLFVLENAP